MTRNESRTKTFEAALSNTRALIRAGHSVNTAINTSADLLYRVGDFDLDELIIELECVGLCEVDSYND